MIVFMFDKVIFVGVILITVIVVVNAVGGAVRLLRMGRGKIGGRVPVN